MTEEFVEGLEFGAKSSKDSLKNESEDSNNY